MPDIRLTRQEENGRLPDVCMCCGDPASERIDRKFPLHEPIVHGSSGFLEIHAIRVLLAAAHTPRIDLRTTFCSQHRNYWRLRLALQFGGLAGMLAVLFFGLGVTILMIFVAKVDKPWLSLCVIVPFLIYVIPWTILWGRTARQTIKVRLAEDETLILCNVDARYIAALEQQRDQAMPTKSRPLDKNVPEAIPVAILVGPSAKTSERVDRGPPRRGKPDQTAIAISVVVGVIFGFLLLVAVAIKVGRMIDWAGKQQANRDEVHDFRPGTVVPNVPVKAPAPDDLKNRPSIDLIPLFNPRKDIVHGHWLVANEALHCHEGHFVPRVQFPYLLPEEYDFVVTFLQPGLRNGISLVMPNPHGGSFFWFLGSENGAGYGFHANPDKRGSMPGLIQANTIHTTKVEVRKHGVRAFVDGKELMHVETDFRDLTSDDWRKLHDMRFPAVACDDATVFYWVRVVEITGKGKNAN